MSLIYEPKGKAREYSPLALNIYSGGCDHKCRYCYCRQLSRGNWTDKAKVRDLSALKKEAATARKQILLSFISDPYCQADCEYQKTREALLDLKAAECSVAILTKGGTRCLRDIDIFKSWPDGRIKVGATLTFSENVDSEWWESGAALPQNRIEALSILHEAGIKTWASIEPVIYPLQSLKIIESSLSYVDAYKVGKWNHDKQGNEIDWEAFGMKAIDIIRKAKKKLYVKKDLQICMPDGYLSVQECDMNILNLPEREDKRALFPNLKIEKA